MIRIYLFFIVCVICGTYFIASSSPISDSTPHTSPLGTAKYIITAFYHDPSYRALFHKEHTGVDMVPVSYRYPTYIYATISGEGYDYSEPCSGKAYIIIGAEYIAYYGHIASYLAPNYAHIYMGEKIAIMGESGAFGTCVTGIHLHYQLYKREGTHNVIIDPLPYLPLSLLSPKTPPPSTQ